MSDTAPVADPAPAAESSNAMSWPSAADIPDPTPAPESTETPAEQEPAPEGTETTPPPEGEPPVETTPPVEPKVFDEAYVEKLRNEAADYRVRAKEFHEAFEGYDDETRDRFLDMARGLNDETRHEEVAREFITIGKRILDHYGIDTGDLAAPDPNRPLTQAQLDARLAQEREERATQERIAQIDKEVTDLGYKAGEPDHYALLRIANESESGSLQEAHEKIEEWKKGIITEWAKSFKEKQDRHLDTAPQVGLAPKEEPEADPVDWAGARGRVEQMLTDRG